MNTLPTAAGIDDFLQQRVLELDIQIKHLLPEQGDDSM